HPRPRVASLSLHDALPIFTDHYRIDARYGGNEGYKRLRDSLQARGMKLVQDAVYNHTGTYHVIVSDLPEQDWLNQWPSFTGTSADRKSTRLNSSHVKNSYA